MSGALSLARELLAMYSPTAYQGKAVFGHCVLAAFILSAAVAWWIEHKTLEDERLARSADIARLTNEPDIDVRIMAVFWDSARDGKGNPVADDSCFYVRLKLINRNDVPCTIDEFWMLGNKCPSFQQKFMGVGVRGILTHSSMYGGGDTQATLAACGETLDACPK